MAYFALIRARQERPGVRVDNLDNLLLIRAAADVVPFSAEGYAFSADFSAKGSHFWRSSRSYVLAKNGQESECCLRGRIFDDFLLKG